MTKTMNEHINITPQEQILKVFFAKGLGEGLTNIAQIFKNTPMLVA